MFSCACLHVRVISFLLTSLASVTHGRKLQVTNERRQGRASMERLDYQKATDATGGLHSISDSTRSPSSRHVGMSPLNYAAIRFLATNHATAAWGKQFTSAASCSSRVPRASTVASRRACLPRCSLLPDVVAQDTWSVFAVLAVAGATGRGIGKTAVGRTLSVPVCAAIICLNLRVVR